VLTFSSQIRQQLVTQFGASSDDSVCLSSGLRLLAKWRSVLIQNTLLQQEGTVVRQGPLAGLDFLPQSAEGCHIAKLLGCYEQPLQPAIEAAIAVGYPTILNIGCAEGYYAVGLARRLANTHIYAHDTNPAAQTVCRQLAEKNAVTKQVSVGGLFSGQEFAAYAGSPVLVLCDIEGAERELLNPHDYPALKEMDIIVESHECLISGVTQLLIDRFQHSHAITLIQDSGQRSLDSPPQWFLDLAHLDQLLATWEWRSGPTPWLVMTANRSP